MDFKRWFLVIETSLINEDFKSQREKFISQGIAANIVDAYLEFFRIIKTNKYKEIGATLPGVILIRRNTV